jgi:uncharacterized protein with LGFP repeats
MIEEGCQMKKISVRNLLKSIQCLLLLSYATITLALPPDAFKNSFNEKASPISQKYQELGGPTGKMGEPLGNILPAFNGGQYRQFKNGYIFWNPNTGAHMVFGAVADKYRAMALALRSTVGHPTLGYPISDEITEYSGAVRPSGPGDARVSHFQGGSIYWSQKTGAHAVFGLIAQRYYVVNRYDSKTGRVSNCGLPISEQQKAAVYMGSLLGTRDVISQKFEFGTLTLPTNGQPVTVNCNGPTYVPK